MIRIDEAKSLVLDRTRPNDSVHRSVREAVGLVLAESIASDIDSPPYDKSLVDGYAIVASDVGPDGASLEVVEEVTAGEVPCRAVRHGLAVRIMTGAPIPLGADAVVMVERTRSDGGSGRVRIEGGLVARGENILRRGVSIRQGERVLQAGHRLRATDVGLLCEVGRTRVRVVRPPRASILATGDELLPAGFVLQPGFIRNSNGPMLCCMVQSAGGEPLYGGICRDTVDVLERAIRRGLGSDLLILSGGVSAGVADLVPEVLGRCGVRRVFHKVFLKPGKPLWFGVYQRQGRETLVFGLPGNPVGSLVCFELFVRPAIRRLLGLQPEPGPDRQARLACEHHQRGDRPTYCPAVAERDSEGRTVVRPLKWMGSADQRAVAGANCLAFFPPGEHRFAAGAPVKIVWLDACHVE